MSMAALGPLVGGGVSGGQGGIDLSGGPATSEAQNETGGAVFNFAPPPSVQKTQSITQGVMLFLVVAVLLWLMTRRK